MFDTLQVFPAIITALVLLFFIYALASGVVEVWSLFGRDRCNWLGLVCLSAASVAGIFLIAWSIVRVVELALGGLLW